MEKIPKSFKLFGLTIKVVFDNEYCNNIDAYGEINHSDCTIRLAKKHKGTDLSKDVILDTFYHEKVHCILESMNERELNSNEKFVDVFAKLLRQSDITAE